MQRVGEENQREPRDELYFHEVEGKVEEESDDG